MRINIYAEELTEKVELIEKTTKDGTFTGVRFWLELPVTNADGTQHQGPFMHHPDDNDSSAVTFWGKRDMRVVLRKALALLDAHYRQETPPSGSGSSGGPHRDGSISQGAREAMQELHPGIDL